MKKRYCPWLFRLIRWLVKLFYPVIRPVGTENLPEEACIIVGNHSQMNGPIACELYAPGQPYIWCAGEMMQLKEVPAYAYRDFWSGKPKGIRWFYKLLSYIIAPLSVSIFNNARTIGVYHDTRILSTFKATIEKLAGGTSVVIFPEHAVPHNHILCQFQTRFVDVAKLYRKRTGKNIRFVPMYLAPALKAMYFGEPVTFDPDAPIEQERERICAYLSEAITRMAVSLPEHRVVPYCNIPKKEYPSNKEPLHETADC